MLQQQPAPFYFIFKIPCIMTTTFSNPQEQMISILLLENSASTLLALSAELFVENSINFHSETQVKTFRPVIKQFSLKWTAFHRWKRSYSSLNHSEIKASSPLNGRSSDLQTSRNLQVASRTNWSATFLLIRCWDEPFEFLAPRNQAPNSLPCFLHDRHSEDLRVRWKSCSFEGHQLLKLSRKFMNSKFIVSCSHTGLPSKVIHSEIQQIYSKLLKSKNSHLKFLWLYICWISFELLFLPDLSLGLLNFNLRISPLIAKNLSLEFRLIAENLIIPLNELNYILPSFRSKSPSFQIRKGNQNEVINLNRINLRSTRGYAGGNSVWREVWTVRNARVSTTRNLIKEIYFRFRDTKTDVCCA